MSILIHWFMVISISSSVIGDLMDCMSVKGFFCATLSISKMIFHGYSLYRHGGEEQRKEQQETGALCFFQSIHLVSRETGMTCFWCSGREAWKCFYSNVFWTNKLRKHSTCLPNPLKTQCFIAITFILINALDQNHTLCFSL